jgi:hypothetical protein
MNRATPKMREVSKALMAHDTSIKKTSAGNVFPAFAIVEKLRPQLANLMGNGGFRALLSRALVLSKEEVTWLTQVQVSESGTLEVLERPGVPLAESEFLEGNEIIVAQLLGLLGAFIGMTLTLQQVKEVWPGFPLSILAYGE